MFFLSLSLPIALVNVVIFTTFFGLFVSRPPLLFPGDLNLPLNIPISRTFRLTEKELSESGYS